jgi:hypothetical protein
MPYSIVMQRQPGLSICPFLYPKYKWLTRWPPVVLCGGRKRRFTITSGVLRYFRCLITLRRYSVLSGRYPFGATVSICRHPERRISGSVVQHKLYPSTILPSALHDDTSLPAHGLIDRRGVKLRLCFAASYLVRTTCVLCLAAGFYSCQILNPQAQRISVPINLRVLLLCVISCVYLSIRSPFGIMGFHSRLDESIAITLVSS